MPPAPDEGSLAYGRWLTAFTVLLLAFLIPAYWISWHAPATGMFHDDGVYLVTAKALATGHGYRIISLPDEIPQTKYPILFPLILSLVWRVAPEFPGNLQLLKLIPLTFAMVWFWLTYRLTALKAPREVAALCAALTAALLWSVYLSAALLSETLFATLCTGCLLILTRGETGNDERRQWMLAAALAGLACLTRTAGVCVVATGVIWFLRQRRIRRALGFLAIALAIYAPWIWWILTQHPPETDAYYSAANYGSWNILSSHFHPDQKIAIVILNAMYLLRGPLFIISNRNGWLDVISGLAFLMCCLRWVKTLTVLDVFLGIYTVMMLAWAWPPDRFMVVVYPVILILGWRLWQALIVQLRRWWATVARIAALVVVATVAGRCMWNLAYTARETLRTGVVLSQDPWRDTSQLLNWIKANTPADAVIMANLDPLFYLYTDRKAVRGFQADPYLIFYIPEPDGWPLGTLAEFRNTLRKDRVTYIVRTVNRTFSEAPYLDRLIMELVASEPESIKLVAQGADPRFQIYCVEKPL